MLKTRIIPCLDVADGRVVKGVNFVDLVDAGDPVESARAYDAGGAPTSSASSTLTPRTENRGTIYDLATRTAEACFMPLTIGGGVRTRGRRPRAAAGRRRQGELQCPPPSPTRTCCRAPPTKFGSQCIVCAIDAKARSAGAVGDLHPWRPAPHRHRRGGLRADGRGRRGPGEILLTSMDRDGTKAGFDVAAHPRHRRRRARAGHRQRWRRHARSPDRGRDGRSCARRRSRRLDLPLRNLHDRARPRRACRPQASL